MFINILRIYGNVFLGKIKIKIPLIFQVSTRKTHSTGGQKSNGQPLGNKRRDKYKTAAGVGQVFTGKGAEISSLYLHEIFMSFIDQSNQRNTKKGEVLIMTIRLSCEYRPNTYVAQPCARFISSFFEVIRVSSTCPSSPWVPFTLCHHTSYIIHHASF